MVPLEIQYNMDSFHLDLANEGVTDLRVSWHRFPSWLVIFVLVPSWHIWMLSDIFKVKKQGRHRHPVLKIVEAEANQNIPWLHHTIEAFPQCSWDVQAATLWMWSVEGLGAEWGLFLVPGAELYSLVVSLLLIQVPRSPACCQHPA